MSLSGKTRARIEARWRAFCREVVKAQEEHGRPVICYFGPSQVVADRGLLEDWHDRTRDRPSQDDIILVRLPEVTGFHQDGGDW